jgi:hypothetical protein
MRSGSWVLFSLISTLGCNGNIGADTDDSAEPINDSDSDSDTSTDTASDLLPFPSSFPGGQFRVTKLQLSTESDTDGDGIIDNNLANMFMTMDLLISSEDLSTETFNLRLQENLGLWRTNVLIEAENDNGVIEFKLYQGINDGNFNLSIAPESLDENGEALINLAGAFTTEQGFNAGPGTISLPVVIFEDDDPLPVSMEQTIFDGVLNSEQSAGVMTGALPIDELIEKVIEPIIDENGSDIDGDGVLESKEEIMTLIESIAPAAGDIDLGNNRTGVSARFSFVATPVEF